MFGTIQRHSDHDGRSGTRTNEFQQLTQAAMKRGFQTRDVEMNLGRLVADLKGRRMSNLNGSVSVNLRGENLSKGATP